MDAAPFEKRFFGKVKIKNEKKAGINPFIYGNFMEYLERHISGMWAELLVNRKFDDVPLGNSVAHFWELLKTRNNIFASVEKSGFNNGYCQKIECTIDKEDYNSIIQHRIPVEKNMEYTGSICAKFDCGEIEVLIGKDYGPFFLKYDGAVIKSSSNGNEWRKHEFVFTPRQNDDEADFCIRFKGAGSLLLENASLMPRDNICGWRKDVVWRIKELKPNIIRFPGGCYADIYHWENAVGDRTMRSSQDNYHWSDVSWDYRQSHIRSGRNYRLIEPNDVGIDEFVQLCKQTGTEPFICVNLGTGTAREAANWVEYCNGGIDTYYGALRAKNGHAEPYNVKYWEIGNEMYGSWETGYRGFDGYVKGYQKFYDAMKKVDDSVIFVANGAFGDWNRPLLKQIGDKIDILDIHCYPANYSGDGTADLDAVFEDMLSKSINVSEHIESVRKDIEECGYKDKIKIAVCEWNITGGSWGQHRVFISTLGNALLCAKFLNVFQKNGDIVDICNFSNLTNAWWASCIRTKPGESHVTAQFQVLSMYSNLCRANVVPAIVEDSGDSRLEITATADGGGVTVMIINPEGISRKIAVDTSGFTGMNDAGIVTLSGPSLESLNDFSIPDFVSKTFARINYSSVLDIETAPYSLTALCICNKIN